MVEFRRQDGLVRPANTAERGLLGSPGSISRRAGTRYHITRDTWGVHFTSSRDDTLFASDGGDPSQVAYSTNGMWINLFRVQPDGTVAHERLANMARHNYVTGGGRGGIEPNCSITPDKKWVVFTGQFARGRGMFMRWRLARGSDPSPCPLPGERGGGLGRGDFFNGAQCDGAQQAGVAQWPIGGVQTAPAAVAAGEIGVVEVFPLDFANVQVANAIGGEVGHVHFQDVPARLKILADGNLIRRAPKGADYVAVDFDDGGFANAAQSRIQSSASPAGWSKPMV